ncbi:hypothetical protein LPJ66_010688 [Kickxella alabastrina]|uniref:Uncharacterized protein n=1 Tax=Kickxella alabastrina TaxID=61397 RepID=A0ACC1I3Y4_9FUNG|nr:hypothetical protein LPJ66_010688 [Kickxella alabastrina]
MNNIRNVAAPYWAEFIGTLVLTLVGLGISAQNLTSKTTQHTEALNSSIGWGIAVTLGIWTSAHVSGGHINPAVSIARALFNGFSPAKLPGYLLAQTLGAFSAAFLVWLNYAQALAQLELTDPTGTHPATAAFITSNGTWEGLVAEVLGSFVFVLVIFAVTDGRSAGRPVAPLVIGLALTGVSLALSSPLAVSINPARDFGPRVFAALAYGFGVFTEDSLYFWVPLVGPVVGAALGAFVYEWLVKLDAEYQQHHVLEEGN